jgi:hypothetical protein
MDTLICTFYREVSVIQRFNNDTEYGMALKVKCHALLVVHGLRILCVIKVTLCDHG